MKLKAFALTAVAIFACLASFHSLALSPTPQAIPTPIDVSKIDFSKINSKDIEATEVHRDALKGEVKKAQEHQAEVISNQGSTLKDVAIASDQTAAAVEVYRKATDAQITRGNQAIAAYEHVNAKNHRAQWVLIALWTVLVGLIVMRLPLAIKSYALIGGGVAVLAGASFIFLWL